MPISAHLNGGPKDDQYMVVQYAPLWVAKYQSLLPWSMSQTESSAMDPSIKKGIYDIRLDDLGQPVPHDLTGTVEFDWKGWQCP